MFFTFLVFVVALLNAAEKDRLLKTNKVLQQALQELGVGQEFQDAGSSANVAVGAQASEELFGEADEVMVGSYGLKGQIGKCPAGKALTLEQCKNEVSFGKRWGGSGKYGRWYSPESCGCYIDQNGKRYFNTNTYYCSSDDGEKLICVVPEPPKTCHNTFRFLETKDGQCSARVTFPSTSLACPDNYARIRTEKECRELLTKNSKNIHWRGSTSPFTSHWPKGCVIHKQRNNYQGYFNTKSSECNTCDKDVAPVCKLA